MVLFVGEVVGISRCLVVERVSDAYNLRVLMCDSWIALKGECGLFGVVVRCMSVYSY